MFGNFVVETAQAGAGTGPFALNGPASGTPYVGLIASRGNNSKWICFAESTTTKRWESFKGTATSGSPNALSRDATIQSWDGVTLSDSPINWASGDGVVRIISIPPAEFYRGIATWHRGPDAPLWAEPGTPWWDDTGGASALVLKVMMADGVSWASLLTFDETAGGLTFPGTISATNGTLRSTDASATAGPTLTLDRNSASPAATDDLGEIKFVGRDDGAGSDTYTRVYGEIVDPTAGSEDGRLGIETKVAGTAADRLFVGAGAYTAGATGGDQGADSLNASAYYDDGVRGKFWPLLATLTASNSASLDFTAVDSALYCGYEVVIENLVAATDNVSLLWRVSTDGGVNFLATSTYNFARGLAQSTTTSAGAGTAGATSGTLATAMGNTAAKSLTGRYSIIVGGAVAAGAKIVGMATYTATDGTVITQFTGDHNTTTSQVNAFRFLMSSGNITSGTIRVFGIPK